MRKHLILTSLVAIATTSIANAATDVTFGGDYKNTSGATVNVADAVAAESYSYQKSNGDTRNVASQATAPTLSDFTYTDKDGLDADLSGGAKVQSDFRGTSAASGVVSTTQEIVSGANVERSNYSYTSGDGNTVELGTAAKDMTQNIALDTTYASGAEITVTNGAASAFDGTLYTVTIDGDDTYHLSADGTTLYHSNNTPAGEPEPGSALADAFAAMKGAYSADAGNIDTAKTNTAAQWADEQTNFAAAEAAFATDTTTVGTLDTRWGTYQTAAGLLATAQANQSAAQETYDANSADKTSALAVYNAPITTTIDGAIDTSIASGSIKTALDGKANNTAVEGLAADIATLNGDSETAGSVDNKVATAIAGEAGARAAATTFDADGKNYSAGSVKEAIASIDTNIGKVHGLVTQEGSELKLHSTKANASTRLDDNGNYVGNLAVGTTIEDHLISLDNGIGAEADRAKAAEAAIRNDFAAADALSLSKANSYTDSKINTLEKNISGGVAAATALSAVSVSNVGKGEVSVGGGYGYYNKQNAMAFGAAMGLTDRWSVNAGAGIASGDKTQFAIRAGTNYKFKLF